MTFIHKLDPKPQLTAVNNMMPKVMEFGARLHQSLDLAVETYWTPVTMSIELTGDIGAQLVRLSQLVTDAYSDLTIEPYSLKFTQPYLNFGADIGIVEQQYGRNLKIMHIDVRNRIRPEDIEDYIPAVQLVDRLLKRDHDMSWEQLQELCEEANVEE